MQYENIYNVNIGNYKDSIDAIFRGDKDVYKNIDKYKIDVFCNIDNSEKYRKANVLMIYLFSEYIHIFLREYKDISSNKENVLKICLRFITYLYAIKVPDLVLTWNSLLNNYKFGTIHTILNMNKSSDLFGGKNIFEMHSLPKGDTDEFDKMTNSELNEYNKNPSYNPIGSVIFKIICKEDKPNNLPENDYYTPYHRNFDDILINNKDNIMLLEWFLNLNMAFLMFYNFKI